MENRSIDREKQEQKYHSTERKLEIKFFQKMRSHFESYCNHTSIHGFQYFGQNRTIIEKCWWTIVFMAIVSGCGFSIYLIYNKWRLSPVIVSLTTKDTPIYEIPFPAVTICPTIKYSNDCINFSALFENYNTTLEGREEIAEYIAQLCQWGRSFRNVKNLKATFSNEIYKTFLNCSPYLVSEVNEEHEVNFMDEFLSFREDFRPLITEDGLCFTFNMLPTEEVFSDVAYIHPEYSSSDPKSQWIPQSGYRKKTDVHTYPRRALWSGAANSLKVVLAHRKSDIDYLCTGAEQGYKVILHFPTRIPRSILEYTMAPFGKATMISVSAQRMATSEVVKNYSPGKRDCYFEGEKKLQFFKIYSISNCAFECLTNFTLKECGCVGFYMPRNESTPICGLPRAGCLDLARKKYQLAKLKSKLKEKVYSFSTVSQSPTTKRTKPNTSNKNPRKKRETDNHSEDEEKNEARCNCLRNCNDVTYTGSTTVLEYNWKKMSLEHNDLNSTLYDLTQISIYFGHNVIFTTERNELYGPTDFLSNFGGLLGLFSGFSILSMMEIIYFCTFRIIGNWKLFGRWHEDKIE
ncbi:hypothetical protein WA026_001528 [Henosepilachna vigintioctopunctata]|uniref:Uncharacterized protein n=1 Tax=Henosepilachna vigintioctopunctata TaxID=420089 RepID=A0AAW1US44_9CUCU